MKLRLARRTLGDLDRICDYLHDRNPAASRRVREAIRASFRIVVDHPEAGGQLRYGVRRLTLPRYPYLVSTGWTERTNDEIALVTIRHGARRLMA